MWSARESSSLTKGDLEIISFYKRYPDATRSQLSRYTGLKKSQIASRIFRLKKNDLISRIVGVDLERTGLCLAKVDVVADNAASILNFFDHCPYFLNGLSTCGKSDLTLFFVGEEPSTLQSIVEHHLGSKPTVKSLEFNLVIGSVNKLVFPMDLCIDRSEEHPCGYKNHCTECTYYSNHKCIGCPATSDYRGRLWCSNPQMKPYPSYEESRRKEIIKEALY